MPSQSLSYTRSAGLDEGRSNPLLRGVAGGSERPRRRHPATIVPAILLAGSFTLSGFKVLAQNTAQEPSPAASQQPSAPAEPLVELAEPNPAGQTGPPLTITLHDALERARKNSPEYLSAVTDTRLAHEDKVQAR